MTDDLQEKLEEIVRVVKELRDMTPPGYESTDENERVINRLCVRQVELFIELAEMVGARETAFWLESSLKMMRVFPT